MDNIQTGESQKEDITQHRRRRHNITSRTQHRNANYGRVRVNASEPQELAPASGSEELSSVGGLWLTNEEQPASHELKNEKNSGNSENR